MKIAIVSMGDSRDKKGAFNATHNRTKHLILTGNFDIDVFLIQTYENFVIRRLRNSDKRTKETGFIYDDIKYINLWYGFSLIDYFVRMKIKRLGPFLLFAIKKWTGLFKNYDLISAHSFDAGLLAYHINKKYKIPFVITWHGSDIHSEPFSNPTVYFWTRRLLASANCNIFVGEFLAGVSEKICHNISRKILYNGVDTDIFRKYSEREIRPIRKRFNILPTSNNIAFIGDLLTIKNAHRLPEIFSHIKQRIATASFYIIGGGKLHKEIEYECNRLKLKVRFLGTQDPLQMPGLINCMDLILLPSQNEGLPLIALESLACGVPIIGSRVGGIVESIGMENTVELDQMFIENFVNKAIDILSTKKEVRLGSSFDWEQTAHKESQLYHQYLTFDN